MILAHTERVTVNLRLNTRVTWQRKQHRVIPDQPENIRIQPYTGAYWITVAYMLLQSRCEVLCLKAHESAAWLFTLGVESTFAILGHNPKSVTSCIISAQRVWPKRIIYMCTVFRGEKERNREGDYYERGKWGTKKRYLIMYAFSCEREQSVWEKGGES